MMGYDNYIAYNPNDNELGEIGEAEGREENVEANKIIAEVFEGYSPVPYIDAEGYLCDRDWWEPAKADPVAFHAQCIAWRESLIKYARENPDAKITIPDDLPEYRDEKFNESTNRYGKGW